MWRNENEKVALEAALTPTGGGLGTGGGAPAATPTPTPSPTPSFDDFGTGIAHYPDQAKPKLGDGPELKAGEPKPGEVAPLGKERAEAAEPSDPPNPSDPEVDELDVLAESLGLKPLSKEDKVEPETPVSLADLDTPEKLTKAINPDGKASEKQQLENLQRLIGRQSSEVKTARQVAQFAHTYAPFMRQAANGQTVMDVVKLSQALPPEVLQAQLDEAGVVLVPRDYLANASQYADYPPDVVDAVIADRDIPYGDKVAQIEQDPKLAAKAEALKLQRQSSIAQQRQAQTSQMLQTLDQLGQKFEGLFKELSAPDPATGQSVFQRFN